MIGSIVVDAGIPGHPWRAKFAQSFVAGDWLPGSYEHEIRARGGFWTAKFTLVGTLTELERLQNRILGFRIRMFNQNSTPAWEGFINSCSLTTQGVTRSTSLDDMFNRVNVKYTTAYTGMTTGPTVQVQDGQGQARSLQPGDGSTGYSVGYDDGDSQNLFGIKQRTLSGGEMDSGAANLLAQRYLASNKMPKILVTKQRSGKRTPMLEIECKGYFQRLDWRQYNYSSGGTAFSETVIADILSTVGGEAVRSRELALANFTVNRDFENDRSAMSIIQDLSKLGASNGTRVNCGVYEDQHFVMEFARASEMLQASLWQEENGVFRDRTSRQLTGGEIRPGVWTGIGLSPIIAPKATAIDQNLSFGYVEAVKYSEPNQVELTVSESALIDVLLSQVTLGGIG